MGSRNSIDECQAKSVAIRFSSLHTAFEQMRTDFWCEARSIILQHKQRGVILRLEVKRHRTCCGQMLEFVVEEIGNHAMDERCIRRNSQWSAATEFDLQTPFRHGRFVQINHDPEQIIQVDLRQSEPQRIRLGLGNVQRLIQELSEAIELLDGRDDRLRLLALRSCQRHLEFSADRCQGATQIVRERVRNGVQLVHRTLDAIEHAVQCPCQVTNFVVSLGCRHSGTQIGMSNPRSCFRNLSHKA